MTQKELPANWRWFYMLDLIDYEGGSQPPKSVFVNEPKDGYIRLCQIRDFGDKPFPTYVPDNKRLKKFGKNDLLLARYGGSGVEDSLGRICTGLEGAYNVALAKLVFDQERLSVGYVRYLFQGPWFREVVGNNSRSCQTGFNRDDLKEIQFPLPPTMEEQRRIVVKLDHVTERIDDAKARLDTVPTTLKRFRQSILTAACSGRLTSDWRKEDATGGRYEEVPAGWRECRFGDVLTELRNGISRKPEITPGGTPILRISAVRPCKIDLTDHRFIPDPTERELAATIQDGDLLFTRYNGNIEFVGVCGVVRGLGSKEILYPDKLMRVRLKKDVTPEWVEIFFSSPNVREAVTAFSKSSAGQNGISGADIKNQPIFVPTVQEQMEIVRRVEALFKQADAIEARYQKARTFVEKLTPSVLAKAFRGELA